MLITAAGVVAASLFAIPSFSRGVIQPTNKTAAPRFFHEFKGSQTRFQVERKMNEALHALTVNTVFNIIPPSTRRG
jgi:hypothetical protein